MPLVFGSIAPHPPILIPTIGGDNLKSIKKTADALKELEEDLYAAKPDSLIVISPHGQIAPDTFLINASPDFTSDLEQFGDFSTKLKLSGDLELGSKLEESAEDNSVPLNLINEQALDHGVSVPLYYLSQHLDKIKILPISYCLLDFKTHFKFGQVIGKEAVKSNKRVAIIASGDLSHRLTEGAPAGYNPEGKKFDSQLVKLLEENNVEGILNLDPALIEEAGECGLRSFIILLGIFSQTEYNIRVMSYEGPFGVGYLVASLTVK